MPNSSSYSKIHISPEVENLSSSNFFVLTPKESTLTPVCGVGEMDESTTPPTEVIVSPVLPSEDILACSPTLVLSGEKSQNSDTQSVTKPND
ncbi:hypothetical protein H5410_050396 [Solanum commersonii]|uniref:Uncharacterized protein n=1 Tax=Solanum commersonii TaxID=4109 RepID=A0A9J5WVD9_SOLCO|nr:hypothetical protein H5410_050396 [Solanum commersonii]